MKGKLTKNFKEGQYNLIDNQEELCVALTKELQELTKDKHLDVLHSPSTVIKQHTKSMQELIREDEIRKGKMDSIRMKIPNRRSISPITNTGWEGAGIIPDIAVEQAKAFDYTYKEKLLYIKETYQNEDNYEFLLKEMEDTLLNLTC
ncbi:hypothetical protein [Priestia taiwanensis]|uniref:Uncharacterized protein n=1 Tax=Priestia taiwanensis TaxID=1347902 RepID=A0A917ALQ0_9BACI|nr:hypothetical protein [Priestia taiwanensis]MBM7362171.1 hypothetical protein [Priestia taiwanensis]GGE59944.1 hypothetical protein GCM10007140_07930 [Priestia taiwanensis]